MKYRAEIDGLRALAVVPVLLFHAGYGLFGGGFVGVDVFFVISGFLITSLLIEDLENHRFSLWNFYERRARRILPALFFVMLVCIPFAWVWMFPNSKIQFSQSLLAVSLFASNILFWKQEDYFASGAEEKPLLHTWSLAVEEQFYIVFPVFLFLAWRFGSRTVFWLVVAFSAASLAMSEWVWRSSPTANFYLAHTRAWELFAGALAAFIVMKRGVRSNNALACIGLAAILFAIFAYDKHTPFPSVYALVPVLGVVLLLLFADRDTLVAKLLSTKIIVGIGLISYSVYLWHQPLFAFARLRTAAELEPTLSLILIAITFVLAYLTWLFIEGPVRKKQVLGSRKALFSASILMIGGFAAMGLAGHKSIDRGGRQTPAFVQKYEKDNDYIASNFYLMDESWKLLQEINGLGWYTVDGIAKDNELWFDLSDDRQKILVAGNSHGIDVYNLLRASKKISEAAQIARYGVQIKNIGEQLYNSPNYQAADVVMYCSQFGRGDAKLIEGIVQKSIADGKRTLVCENMFVWMGRSVYTRLDKYIMNELDADVSSRDIALNVNQKYTSDYKNSKFLSSDYQVFFDETHEQLALLSKTMDFDVINRMDYVCASGTCELVGENLRKYFYDIGHHTMDGAIHFGQVIDEMGLSDRILGLSE